MSGWNMPPGVSTSDIPGQDDYVPLTREEAERQFGPIKTSFDYPPIPVRDCDWSAHFPDIYDGAPDSSARSKMIGRGATEEAAIADLLEQAEEYAE